MAQDGANNGGDNANVEQQQENKPANTQTGGGNSELEAIKKELASRDKKIAELLEAEKARNEEAEKQRQASLSTEEQLKEVKQKLDRQDKLSSYLGMGLSNEQANAILEAPTEAEKAKLIYKYASEKSVEGFKAAELQKVPPEAKPNNEPPKDDILEDVKKELGI